MIGGWCFLAPLGEQLASSLQHSILKSGRYLYSFGVYQGTYQTSKLIQILINLLSYSADYYTRVFLNDHTPSEIAYVISCTVRQDIVPLTRTNLQLDWECAVDDAVPPWNRIRQVVRRRVFPCSGDIWFKHVYFLVRGLFTIWRSSTMT